jgi:hypothetical protein
MFIFPAVFPKCWITASELFFTPHKDIHWVSLLRSATHNSLLSTKMNGGLGQVTRSHQYRLLWLQFIHIEIRRVAWFVGNLLTGPGLITVGQLNKRELLYGRNCLPHFTFGAMFWLDPCFKFYNYLLLFVQLVTG